MIPRRRRNLGVFATGASRAVCLADLLSILAWNYIRTAGTPEGDAYRTLFKSLYEADYVTLAEEYPGLSSLFTPMPRWDALIPIFVLLKAGFGMGTEITPIQIRQLSDLRVGLPFTSDESKRAWYQRLMAYPSIDFGAIPQLTRTGATFDDAALASVRATLTARETACRSSGVAIVGPFVPVEATPPPALTPPQVIPTATSKKSDVGPFMVGAALAFLISRFF